MNVYLVYEGEYSDRMVLYVAKTLEIASALAQHNQDKLKHLMPHTHKWETPSEEWEQPGPRYWYCTEKFFYKVKESADA
jgi:hypothetical protein